MAALKKIKSILILYNNTTANILLEGNKLCCDDIDNLPLALITTLAYYYLFDMEYPINLDVGYSFLQYIIFKDKKVQPELKTDLDKFMNAYTAFKVERLTN